MEGKYFNSRIFRQSSQTSAGHMVDFIGELDQVFVKPLTPLIGLCPFGHDDAIAKFFGLPRTLGKSKI
jgi:hypothetical protein